MKVGDTLELAVWLTGEETLSMVAQWRVDAPYIMARSQGEPIAKLGPVAFEIKRPGDHRVPEVPDHVHGHDVRLLIATADVVGFESAVVKTSFVAELERSDLLKLRALTRKTMPKVTLSDEQCDGIIEQIGPVTALQTLRQAEGRALH